VWRGGEKSMADTSQMRRFGPMLALAIMVLAAGYWRTVGDTVDNAWITFRCVDHLVLRADLASGSVRGPGPGWPGLTREEYTGRPSLEP